MFGKDQKDNKNPEVKEIKREFKKTDLPPSGLLQLTPDAFTKAPEIKRLDKDFTQSLQSLYKSTPHYSITEKDLFQTQMKTLLNAISQWGRENKLNTNELKNIDNFCDYLFTLAGEQQPPMFFIDIKKNLENILSLLHSSHIPELRKKSLASELARNMVMCGPGLYRHIESTRQRMENPVSWGAWLAECRTTLIGMLADKHIAENKIPDGNSIHVHNAFLMHAIKKGWAPLSNVDQIKEHFIDKKITKIDENVLQRFENEFLKQYNFRYIIDFISTSFISEFQNQRRQLEGVKENEGAKIPFSNKIIQIEQSLLTALNFDVESVFETVMEAEKTESKEVKEEKKEKKADTEFLQFKPEFLKNAILKYCYDHHVLIPQSDWVKENVFGTQDYQLVHPKDLQFADLACPRNEKTGEIAYIQNLTDEAKRAYHTYSWMHFQSADRFRLYDKRLPAVSYFPSPKLFQDFIKQLEDNGKLLENAEIFTELLYSGNLVRLVEGLENIKKENLYNLLKKMEIDYILLTPQNPLYETVKSLPSKTDKLELATTLSDYFHLIEAKKMAFKQRLPKVTLPIDSLKENKWAHDHYLSLINNVDKATELEQFMYQGALAGFYPEESKGNTRYKPSQAFKMAHEYSQKRKTEILYSELVEHADKATEEDQFIYEIYLKRYFPRATVSSSPSKAFKEAHEKSIMFSASDDQMKIKAKILFNYAKDGNVLAFMNLINSEVIKLRDDIVRWLQKCDQQSILNYGYMASSRNLDKKELFSWALDCFQRETINIMLDQGEIDINEEVEKLNTPLGFSVSYNDIITSLNLIQRGASIHLGELLHIAIYRDSNPFLIKYIIENRAAINTAKLNGDTPLHWAVEKKDVDLVKYLVDQGADINATNKKGKTPFSEARDLNQVKMMYYLIDHKANLNLLDAKGQTLLHIAVKNGELEMVKYLVERKADPDTINQLGETPLQLAVAMNQSKIKDYLLQAGGQSLRQFKHPIRSNLTNTPNLKSYFLAATFKEKLATKEITLSAEYFKSVLCTVDMSILRYVLEGVSTDKIMQLLDALEADFILLTPNHYLHGELIKFMTHTPEQKDDLSQKLAARIKYIADKKSSFLQKKSEDKKDSKATAESKSETSEILYSELLKRADNASDEDQFIYAIYLRRYFPHAIPSPMETPAKAFKKAHENSITGCFYDPRDTHLFNLVKDGNLKGILEDKYCREAFDLEIEHFFKTENLVGLTKDKSQMNVITWATTCCKPALLDYIYNKIKQSLGKELYALKLFRCALICRKEKEFTELLNNRKFPFTSEGMRILTADAVICGYTDWVEYILREFKKPNESVRDNLNAQFCLDYAAKHGQLGLLQFLLDQAGYDKFWTSSSANEIIFNAAREGHLPVVKYLIEHKVDVDAGIKKPQNIFIFTDETPLRVTPYSNLPLIKYLMDQKAYCPKDYINVDHILCRALEQGYLSIATYLVNEKKANPNYTFENITTLMHVAATNQFDAVKFLLDAGAHTINQKDKHGRTAYDLTKNPNIKKLLLSAELLEYAKKNEVKESKESRNIKETTFFASTKKKKIHDGAIVLKEALDHSFSSQKLEELGKRHPSLNEPPLADCYKRAKELLAATPSIELKMKGSNANSG